MAPTQTLSYDAAVDLATRLRKQKLPFSRIAQELKSRGYISPRTGKPLREMAVRYMITSDAARTKEEKAPTADRPISLTTGTSFKDTLKVLINLEELDANAKLQLIKSMLTL